MKLNKLQYEALEVALNTINHKMDLRINTINNTYMARRNGESLKYGVNWCAQGTQTPDVALAYAINLQNAAKLAGILNRMNITYDPSIDPSIDYDTFQKYVNGIVAALECEMEDLLVDIFNKMV